MKVRVWIIAAMLTLLGTGWSGVAQAEKTLPIGDGMKVTLEYTLTLPDKSVADSTEGKPPFSFTYGNQEIIPGLEKALSGLKEGDKKRVAVSADEAYGPYEDTCDHGAHEPRGGRPEGSRGYRLNTPCGAPEGAHGRRVQG